MLNNYYCKQKFVVCPKRMIVSYHETAASTLQLKNFNIYYKQIMVNTQHNVPCNN